VTDTGSGPSTGTGAGGLPWLGSYPDTIDWHMAIEPCPVHATIDEAARRFGTRVCAQFLGRSHTFDEVAALSDQIAGALQAEGLGTGDRIGLMLPNSVAYIGFYYGVLKTGATVVNLNPLYSTGELEYILRDADCALVVTFDLDVLFEKVEALVSAGAVARALVCPFTDELPWIKGLLMRLFQRRRLAGWERSVVAGSLTGLQQFLARARPLALASIDPNEDIAVLQYTGGTTGTPKGAMLTHANITANLQQVEAWFDQIEPGEERVLAVLPFFHVFAMTAILNLGIKVGAQLLLMPRFEMKAALKLMRKARPTVLPGVPTLFNALLNDEQVRDSDLASLTYCISGGAPLPYDVKLAFEKRAGCTLVEGYGLSETSPVATCNLIGAPGKPGSIGIPLPGTRVSIRSLDDPAVELPVGEDGELCIAGPQVMKGYWKNSEETEAAFVGEYFRTGDVGHMDEDGHFFIVDRIKDIINCSGFKVYPRHVEEAIQAHPAVAEVTVIGIADEYRGEAPKAFIKLRAGAVASADDILKFLEPRLSPIELPDEIEFRDELPKTLVGKLSKKELRGEGA